jgi:hypothetical protein
MTMVNKLMEYPSALRQAVGSVELVLDATGERCGCVQSIKQAGNIAKVIFYNLAVTTGDTIKASIQTVGADGLPSGTVWTTATGAKAYGTVAISSGDAGWHTVTFDEVAPVVAGDIIALVFEWNNYVSGNMKFYTNNGIGTVPGVALQYPYCVSDITATTGTWIKHGTYGCSSIAMVLEYSGGAYYINTNAEGCGATASYALGTGSNPDEVGLYFQVPFTMRAYGFWLQADVDYDLTVSLLDASNTVLANRVLDSDYRFTAGIGAFLATFDSDPAAYVTLQSGTWYRLILTPSSASTCKIYFLDVPSAAAMAVVDGGTLCYATSRVDGGNWTNTDTRRYALGLLIDQIDISAGGGGGRPEFRGGNL